MSKLAKPTVTSPTHNESFNVTVDAVKNYAIFTLDKEGCITSWNKGAVSMTGWNRQEVMGRYLGFLYDEAEGKHEQPQQNLMQALNNGAYEDDIVHRKKDGQVFLANVSIFPITDVTEGYIAVIKDITQRQKDTADQLDANLLLRQEITRRRATQKALKESNDELNAFASAASHDLQEPLRMVVSYLQLIEKRYKDLFDRDGREFLEFAIDGANRMRSLIIDLVEYSRIETLGKPFKNTDAEAVLKRVLTSLEVSIEERNAQITHSSLPVVWSDEVQLNELLQNLIANAIKFGDPKRPKVHIDVKVRGEDYVFSVTDNGHGIEAKDFDSIFLIFKQLGNRAERTGSGVGLSIAKKIVTRHHGRIWLESTIGKGTTFYFSIPAKPKKRSTKKAKE